MKHTPLPPNFIYPEIKPEDYIFGSSQLLGTPLRPDGDWRGYTPPDEEQRRHGIESSSCYIQALQRTITTILEEQYGIADSNFSERFNFIRSNGTQFGGNPLKGIDSIRNDGMIPDSLLPFSEQIESWQDFCSYVGGLEAICIQEGKYFNSKWEIGYDIVFTRNDSILAKYAKLREALKFSPVPMSVCAWYQDAEGNYVKPLSGSDNHLVFCVYLDEENHPYILDTYAPFIKKLAPLYDSEFAMRLSVKRKVATLPIKQPFWKKYAQFFKVFCNPVTA